jgi:altronate hydrolase
MPNNFISFSQAAIRLDVRDPLAITKIELTPGAILSSDSTDLPFQELTVAENIPAGHKLALQALSGGEEVLRYGHRIGVALHNIAPGEWIHTHNLGVGSQERDLRTMRVVPLPPPAPDRLEFMGFTRPRGLCGTRNYIFIISTVNCAAQTARAIAAVFTPENLSGYPNIDGVVAITHHTGCSFPEGSLSHQYLQRSLANLIDHPNAGGVIFVGLGCEMNQMAALVEARRSHPSASKFGECVIGPYLNIQDMGGIEKTTTVGQQAVSAVLPLVNALARKPVSLSNLKVAVQCGGSDSWSGITANPLIGAVADQIVYHGGTVVLSETPEIFGAEQLLTSRLASKKAGRKLVARIKWWQRHAKMLGFSLDNNPSPGNKAGGLTTIFEKSLGAISKGGSTPLVDVYDYAERITSPGLVFMDTPGNDPVSVTGQVGGGCNLVLFSTGRGSVFGGTIAPCLKIASNSPIFQQMSGDMDFDAGALLAGKPASESAAELLDLVICIASGLPTKAESKSYREAEFVPWQPGVVL